jgi:Tol biopolymer transport system component
MRIALAASAVLIVVLAVPAVLYVRGPDPPEAFPMRVPVIGGAPDHFAVSPDGREIALVAQPEGQESTALYVRRIDAPVFRKLNGTDGAVQPFWSPDSQSVAFVNGGRLKRVDAAGGAPRDIAQVTDFSGGAWNRAGTILFGSGKGLFRVPAEGGSPQLITQIDKSESGHFWPSFLPDDMHYLFSVWSDDPSRRAVYVGALESSDRTRLMAGETNAVYAAYGGRGVSGYLLFHRQASLVAQAFDAGSRTLSGVDGQVAGGLAFSAGDGRGSFSASANGVLVFHQGTSTTGGRGRTGNAQFDWVTRTGESIRVVVAADQYGDMDLSGDQRFVAITKLDEGTPASDIWVIDIEKGNPTRLTLDPADDLNPVWSPNGDQIAFTSYRAGNADIFIKNANGVGPDTPLVQTAADELVEGWSHDGRHLAYVAGREGFQDIHVLPFEGDRKPVTVVQGPYRADEPQFSYDGKWLAYTSDESAPGKFEVYVVSFPGLDQKRKISVDGGGQPRWRRDGRELFYRTVAGYMAVEFLPGPNVDSGVPRSMFAALTLGGGNLTSSDPTRHQWAVAPDGQSFLVRAPPFGRRGGAGIPSAARLGGQGPGRGRGRGGPFGGFQVAPTLNVILHWPASLGSAGK